jgi:superfamily II DNA or RNA helicase
MAIRITVDNRLRVALADLPPGVAEALKAECQHANPAYHKAKSMGFKAWNEKPVIATWRERKGELTLPRGATTIVRKVFADNGLEEPDWDDQRATGLPYVRRIVQEHKRVLWDHQEDVVEAALARENCLVRAPTGSGKTSAAIALAVRCKMPTLVIVWSSNLFDQWMLRLTEELGLSRKQIGQIRGSKRTSAPITMAMQQTLYANPKLVREIRPMFGCVMADEVQRFAARTFMDVIDAFPAKYRVGWSADETRKDRKEFLIYDVFGTVAADIDRDMLVKKRLVHDVEVRVVPTDFTADWYVQQMRDDEQTPDFNALLDSMASNAARNAMIMTLARCEQAFGNQVLALTHRREHATGMARAEMAFGGQCGVLLGGPENGAEFVRTVEAMRKRKLHFAAGTYQAIGQGLDIPSVTRGIACTPIATNRQFFGQVRGRLCRRADGKRDAVLYYLWDRHVFGLEPIMALKRWNKVVKVQHLTAGGEQWLSVEDFIDEWNRRK